MVLDPIPQSLPVHFFGSRPQPPTSRLEDHRCDRNMIGQGVGSGLSSRGPVFGAFDQWDEMLVRVNATNNCGRTSVCRVHIKYFFILLIYCTKNSYIKSHLNHCALANCSMWTHTHTHMSGSCDAHMRGSCTQYSRTAHVCVCHTSTCVSY